MPIGMFRNVMSIGSGGTPIDPTTWSELEQGYGIPTFGYPYKCSSAQGVIAVIILESSSVGVTYDGGESWDEVANPALVGYTVCCDFDPDDSSILFIGGDDLLRKVGAAPSTVVLSPAGFYRPNKVLKLANGEFFTVFGTQATIGNAKGYWSSDGGVSWSTSANIATHYADMLQLNGGRVVGIGRYKSTTPGVRLDYSDDDGRSWTTCTTSTIPQDAVDAGRLGYNPTTGVIIVVTGGANSKVLKSTDGITFTDVVTGGGTYNYLEGVTYNKVNKVWFIGCNDTHMIYSDNDFTTFSYITRDTASVGRGVITTDINGKTFHLLADGYGVVNPPLS